MQEKRGKIAEWFLNRKKLEPLDISNVVRMQPRMLGLEWRQARVDQRINSRSYVVKTEDGTLYRRNHQHLRRCPESTHSMPAVSITSKRTSTPMQASITENKIHVHKDNTTTQHNTHIQQTDITTDRPAPLTPPQSSHEPTRHHTPTTTSCNYQIGEDCEACSKVSM